MSMTDPIADFLTRIRNANTVRQEVVEAPSSRLKIALAEVLKQEGFIKGYDVVKNGPYENLRIYLKYGANKERVITGLRRISKPGRRVYARQEDLPRVLGGLGIAVISTSQGVMSDKQARGKRLGGEVICYIW